MRGLIVVALGAILIWFGLSRGSAEASTGDESNVADERGGDRETADTSARLADLGASLRPRADERDAVADTYAPSEPVDVQTPTYETERYVGEPSERDALEPPASEDVVESEEEWSDPAPPVSEPEIGFGGREARPNAPVDDGTFELGRAASAELVLPVLLLEAWLDEEPADLLVYLQDGDGADLPMAKRQLCAAFWESLAGRPEDASDRLDAIRGGEGVTTTQLGLLDAALDPPGRRAVPRAASMGRREPLAHAMRMMLLEDEARSLVREREYARAAVAWSDLIQHELEAAWAPHRERILAWGHELEQVQASHRFAPKGAWPYVEEKVQPNDNLVAVRKRVIRRRSDLNLCTGLISAVNGVRGYIHAGDVLRIPLDPVNVVVDLDARVLLYRHGDEVVRLWDVGIGKEGHDTPIGEFTIGHKIEKPAHTTRELPYGHPDNPLGSRWLALDRDGRNTSYGIHGTGDPDGVGDKVSLGCIRMRNEDVNELFEILPRGATVIIQP